MYSQASDGRANSSSQSSGLAAPLLPSEERPGGLLTSTWLQTSSWSLSKDPKSSFQAFSSFFEISEDFSGPLIHHNDPFIRRRVDLPLLLSSFVPQRWFYVLLFANNCYSQLLLRYHPLYLLHHLLSLPSIQFIFYPFYNAQCELRGSCGHSSSALFKYQQTEICDFFLSGHNNTRYFWIQNPTVHRSDAIV